MKLIKIPFSGGGMGKGNGANLAPDIICKYLTFPTEEIPVDEFNIKQSHQNIYNYIKEVKEKAILIGGDHSISYPAIKGFAQNHKDFKLIVFDAHPDLVNHFHPPSHEDYLRTLIEDNVVKAENVLIVGVRNSDQIETDYIKKKKIKLTNELSEEILDFAQGEVYLSIDIDVINPSEAPGTGYPEKGGFSSKDFLNFLEKLKQKNVQMSDIVEINPKKDIQNKTSKLVAEIILKLSKSESL